jgi:hypothetical protein
MKYEGITPGWKIAENDKDVIVSCNPDANDQWVIAECSGPDGEANAKLIADAPKLAERVEELEAELKTLNMINDSLGRQLTNCTDYNKLAEQNEKMLAMLKRAHKHLDYTGYGDSWERECAKGDGIIDELPALIAEIEG